MRKRPAGYEDHQRLITYGEALALVQQSLFDFTKLVLDGRYLLNPDRPQPPLTQDPPTETKA